MRGGLGFLKFQIDAEVADFGEAQAGEGGAGFGHGFEDFLDGVDAVAAAEGRFELKQNLEVVHGVAGNGDRFVEPLEPARVVDHGAAFFGEACAGQDVVGEFGHGAGQD